LQPSANGGFFGALFGPLFHRSDPVPQAPTDVGDVDSGSCAGGDKTKLPDPASFGSDSGAAIQAISQAAEANIKQCCPTGGNLKETKDCLANALDDYAAALTQIAPQMPEQLRNLPNIVATAANRVRGATSKRAALSALKVAITAVHKSIALLRADDPVTLKAETREGAFVAEMLQAADTKLERAVGL
jgi:hypothetical protein